MTIEQVHKLLSHGTFPKTTGQRNLIETHISWVIVCERFVYKIKKPIRYSFLDFSTLEKRRFFCHREIDLNQRLTDDIYLDVQPVMEKGQHYYLGQQEGRVIDYAVRMHRMDPAKQMDILLKKNKVGKTDIKRLAEKIARFHARTEIIYNKNQPDIQQLFNDLAAEQDYLSQNLHPNCRTIITTAINTSNTFLCNHKKRVESRLQQGFVRDCHGDLHTRNIFLLPLPQPFDCIEFNDDFRQIDVLNEVAFLCMDLDAFGRQDLAELFLEHYNACFPALVTPEDRELFIYYKSYRANIRAKVNSLRAGSAVNPAEKQKALAAAEKYLQLMNEYLKSIL